MEVVGVLEVGKIQWVGVIDSETQGLVGISSQSGVCPVIDLFYSPPQCKSQLNPRSLVCPVIDVIDQDTFDYRASGSVLKGGFDWGLHFRWVPLTEEEAAARTDPTSVYR
ncbi:Polypeptide N-acetylgalactosaminyltransferase 14 [Portunus trituberculatus]|uniref:Polypeptide N-acetylgalactosaminyltransferase 14 n=1 Tax=Portunus trituberculatus TaxID=210409 RepID=A0A5B7GBT6_PORTR|nr:Polypeptide N-acetylgalactosaminyltransferase 14 [Portunus trituberculatus]